MTTRSTPATVALPDVWPGMPADAWKALGEYVRWMADRLWLKDWTFTLDREPLPSDHRAMARCTPTEGRKLASIEFSRGFLQRERDEIKNTVIHELLHAAHRDMTDVIRCVGNEHVLGQQAWDVWWETFRIAYETFVDSMANAFAAQVSDDTLLEEIIRLRPG